MKLRSEDKFLATIPEPIAHQAIEELIRAIEASKDAGTIPLPAVGTLGLLLIQAIEKELGLPAPVVMPLWYNESTGEKP